MAAEREKSAVLDAEFLLIRAKILEIAASLDRIDRAEGALADDSRISQIRSALDLLGEHQSDRAEQIQLVFSREYDSRWEEVFAATKN